MSKIKKAGIVTNLKRDADFSKTQQIMQVLKKNGVEPVLPPRKIPNDNILKDVSLFEISDIIITLGGDGTILSIAEEAALHNIPVMGVNIGNLGYLTDCAFEYADESIKRLIRGEFVCQKRMMLNASVFSGEAKGASKTCLNDVCIIRGATSKIIRFELHINDSFVDYYNADGIIISTPTGSTAYNLSAGGPILIPSSKMIAITPICPHMLATRPIVVSSDDKITVKIGATRKETMITLDGQEPVILNEGDTIRIEKAETYLSIIKTNKMEFYDILRKKLINAGTVDM